jgi:hypothetical protein
MTIDAVLSFLGDLAGWVIAIAFIVGFCGWVDRGKRTGHW